MVTHSDSGMRRPDHACTLCLPPTGTRTWTPADPGYRTCGPCLDRLRTHLADIRDRYHQLNARPGAGAQTGGRGAPGFRSTPPANLHVIAMRDPRSSVEAKVWVGGDGRVHAEHTRAPASIRTVLETEAVNVAELRGMALPTGDVAALARWLDRQLDWITREELVVGFAHTIRGLRTQLMSVTGDPRIWVARCPNVLDLGEQVAVCDANLYYPQGGDTIMCGNPGCKRRWSRHEWNSDTPGSLANLIKVRRPA